MKKLADGARRFRTEIFPSMHQHFQALAAGQQPPAVFITCSDSRIDPHLLTQCEPGTLFTVRNAGNVVPRDDHAGEGAAIEYAVRALGVKHIVICGHYGCGAMRALLEPEQTADLPLVREWLTHAGEVHRQMMLEEAEHAHRNPVDVAVERNVVLQLEHLRCHPAVAQALAAGELDLAGWVYDIAKGTVLEYDEGADAFVVMGEEPVSG